MPTPEQTVNLLEVLATASIIGVGCAIGETIVEPVLAGMISNLGSTIIRQGSLNLKARWLSSDSGILNHDIQNALTRALIEALKDLETKYFETGEAHGLPRDEQTSIRQLFRELREQAPQVFASSLERAAKEQDVNIYLYATQKTATDRLWEQMHGTPLLSTYNEHFKHFLHRTLLDAVQFRFGEELKKDNKESNKAWRAFQRWLLEGIQADVKELKESLALIRQDLQELAELSNQLDRLRDMIDCRLPDEPFQLALGEATNQWQKVLEDRFEPQPELQRNVFDDKDPNGLNRFFYGARKTPFLGREKEINALENFLADEKRFCWWIVIGQGGLGKSRLALELCLRSEKDWRAGFLPSWCSPDDYRNWVPNQPTLIIADYAASRPTVIGTIVRMMKTHADNDRVRYPVRLLLLERRIQRFYEGTAFYTDARKEEWFNNFLGGSRADQAAAQSTWFANGQTPIELGPLDPEHTWTIIRTFGKEKAQEEEKGQILGELQQIDSLCRPLYAAMLGDAIGADRSRRQWDASAILRDVLAREEKMFWTPAGVSETDKDVLALVTMAGDIDTESAFLPREIREMIKDEDFSPGRYRLISAGSTNTILRPLEPDIIGEMFVLEHLNPENSRRDQIATMAWVGNSENMTLFLLRATNDFPKHPTLEYLLGIL
jgi:hypothetical protein